MVLSRLHSYATYEVFLAASTVNGTGPFARQTGQTIESAPESPPQNFTANSSTPYTIVMEWRPPDESEWNGILRGYRLRYSETVSVDSSPEVYTWLEIQISSANQTTFTLHGLCPSTVYCIQIAAVTVESGPYTSPLYIETLEGPTTSGNGSDTNRTINGGGDLENATIPLNETVITRRDSVSAIIAGSVVATVVCLTLVGVAFSLGVAAILRQKRRKKNFSLAAYFTAPMSGDPLHQQQIHSQGDEVSTGLTFTNPSALSFELQPNPSYDHPLPSLPPPPSTTATEGELTPSTENEGRTLSSSSVMIADNPQYRQFSSQQLRNRSTGGMAGVIISAPEVSEGDYDYPATFRVLAQTPENDPYSDTRTISDQSEDPPYATVT
ncbi:Down syndrome cell adhesion molecule-like protein 1 homolog [Geodia barretti]|nr:Down syndrome cell adhesion molecule-like protein 1 homolog [Geodia barretti]